MKKSGLLLFLFMFSSNVMAGTLEQTLVKTYKDNPRLVSARKSVMAGDEVVSQALSGWRPTISAGGSIAIQDTDTTPDASADGHDNTKKWDLSIVQPIYKGGATVASTKSAKNNVRANHENLRATENDVLLSAVRAYVDVIRDEAILELNKLNMEVLVKNLEATEARFDVGELTITDVSQSEASLSNARANVVTAQGDLNSSTALYYSIVGEYPESLKAPSSDLDIPASKDLAISQALKNSPDVLVSQYLDKAAESDIDVINAELLPSLNLTGSIDATYDPSNSTDDVRSSTIKASLTVPLYKSGSSRSKIRQAKHKANQKRIEVLTAQRDVEANTIAAWEDYKAAQSNIVARESQINANEIALQGVFEEEKVGARTVLDVLDAENDLLNSKVELVKANRNKTYSAYKLIANMGKLTAKDLSLPADYWNADDNYNKVKSKWWGTGVN